MIVPVPSLVLLRHGESLGNADELFSGLLDVPITPRGEDEARRAGAELLAAGLWPTRWLVSPMLRARQTADALLSTGPAPVVREYDGRLLERSYGALTGRSKQAVRLEYGEEQFRRWRRSVDAAPPPLSPDELARLAAPLAGYPHTEPAATESLADVVARVEAAYREVVLPVLAGGESLLVVAHGNSLRALLAVVDELTGPEIESLNIPNAHPLVHPVGPDGVPLARRGRYLDPDAARAAAEVIARAGGT